MAKKDTNKKAITNQRTPEEIKEIIEEIDKEVPDGKKFVEIMGGEEEKDKEEDTEEMEEENEPEETEEEVVEEQEEESEEESEVEPVKKNTLPSTEERLIESGKEATVLYSKNKKILETIEEAENIGEPSMDELKEYAKTMGEDYENLEPFAQNMLKESLQNKRRFGKISDLVAQEKQVSLWMKKVDDFLELESTAQNYPDLVSDPEAFKKYCSKKTHINADFDLLVGSFFFKSPVLEKKKSVLLPRGGGSRNQPPKPQDLTQDDAQVIRKKDQKKYMEMARKGKFKISV